MKTIYIDPKNGCDLDGDGTENSPYCTLSHILYGGGGKDLPAKIFVTVDGEADSVFDASVSAGEIHLKVESGKSYKIQR
jgi:hypothetical protein